MPIDTEVGEISRDEIVAVVGGGGVVGGGVAVVDCECAPAPPQPQFNDARNRTPMQVTTFLIMISHVLRLWMPERIQSHSRAKSLHDAPQSGRIDPTQVTVSNKVLMQSNGHAPVWVRSVAPPLCPLLRDTYELSPFRARGDWEGIQVGKLPNCVRQKLAHTLLFPQGG